MNNKIIKLLDAASQIEETNATISGDLGFLGRAFLQATLPHRKVSGSYFERENGNFKLMVMSPPEIGVPFGTIPRILLAWITTEAVKTKTKELELGNSMTSFMNDLGMTATGGVNGSIGRLKNQTQRLFSSSIRASYTENGQSIKGTSEKRFDIADQYDLWWERKNPDQMTLWKSSVILTDNFYREITDRPVPVDLRALKALKGSSLGLDIYSWLSYRMSYLQSTTIIPWEKLSLQFGSDYKELRDFKRNFLKELKKVLVIYDAKTTISKEGLMLHPSLTLIRKVEKTRS